MPTQRKNRMPPLFSWMGTGGLPWVIAAGLGCAFWAAFLGWRGHQPSFVGWPVAAEHYYFLEAVFAIPLIAFCFSILLRVLFWRTPAHLQTDSPRADDPQQHDDELLHHKRSETRGLVRSLGKAYGLSILFFFIAFDVVLYDLGGFEVLALGVRFVMPTLAIGCILALSRVLIRRGWRPFEALFSSSLAVLAQGVIMGLFWR